MALGFAHLALWFFALPLPHIDFNFYVDPAVQLARTGRLISPAAQHLDLTYPLGFFYLPPVYFFTLAGWLTCFGTSYRSVLGFTLLLHQLWLVGLWTLLRRRFECGPLAAALGLVCGFPLFNHGRPELLVHCWSVAGWLAATAPNRAHWIWGGGLLGLAVATSPQFGGSAAVAIAAHLLIRPGSTPLQRALELGRLTSVAVLVAGLVIVGIAANQGSLGLGWAQFQSSTQVRGRELNIVPPFLSAYHLTFTGVGLGVLTVGLAVGGQLTRPKTGSTPERKPAVAAYFAGLLVWLALARGYFFAWAHFAYLAQPVLHAQVAAASRGRFRPIAWIGVSLFAILHFYFGKAQFWFGARSVMSAQADVRSILTAPDALVGEDFFTYAALADRPHLLHFELTQWHYWPRFLEVTPAIYRARLPQGDLTKPLWPDRLIITAATLSREGAPDPNQYVQIAGTAHPEPVVLWGRKLSLLRDPLALCLFERRLFSQPIPP